VEPVVGCTRCGGFIIPEAFRDIGLCSVGWRCLLCGEVVDSVILRNRAVPLVTSLLDEDPPDWERENSANEYEWEAMT
jgi:hypothetical protein